jgi:hypothetical protein
MSLTDFLMSGVFERHPKLVVAYSEGQIGWIPYVLERADKVWEDNRGWGGVADKVLKPPSEYYKEHDNVTFETDYPHSDSTWPDTEKVAQRLFAGLDDETIRKLVRGNAIRMLQLDFEP